MRLKLLPLWGGLLLFIAVSAKAGDKTKTSPMRDFSVSATTAAICVSVSTSAWTAFPPITTANLVGRDGVNLVIQSSSTAEMVGMWDKDTNKYTTPTTAAIDFRIPKDGNAGQVYISEDWRIWLKSMYTASDTVCGREFVQQ